MMSCLLFVLYIVPLSEVVASVVSTSVLWLLPLLLLLLLFAVAQFPLSLLLFPLAAGLA